MNLSPHFSREEFACRCGCGFDTVDIELIHVLELARQHFNSPVTVTSGARCAAHNKSIDGSQTSQHLIGRAADIQIKGVPPDFVYEFFNALEPGRYGIGLYPSWLHIDTRGSKSRWAVT